MRNARPVSAFEVYWHIWPVPLLVLVCIYRLLLGYVMSRQIWLSDMQIAIASLEIAVLLLAGSFVGHRAASNAVSFLAGSAAWLTILTLIPPKFWSGYAALRSEVPRWLLIALLALALAGFIVRWWLSRVWLRQLTGHGYKWMHNWSMDKPLNARLLAQRVLANLGYSFDPEEDRQG